MDVRILGIRILEMKRLCGSRASGSEMKRISGDETDSDHRNARFPDPTDPDPTAETDIRILEICRPKTFAKIQK